MIITDFLQTNFIIKIIEITTKLDYFSSKINSVYFQNLVVRQIYFV
jgi:hypothetical protein